jgi:hypothetical protein
MGKWAKIGVVCNGKEGGTYFKFADNITILKDGEEMEMNKSRTANIEMNNAPGALILGEIFNKETKIAEIRKGKDGKKNYISFDKTVSFKQDTVPFKANKNNAAQLQDPIENLEKRIKRGFVKEEDVERLRSKTKEIATWLQYEVTMPDDTPMKTT